MLQVFVAYDLCHCEPTVLPSASEAREQRLGTWQFPPYQTLQVQQKDATVTLSAPCSCIRCQVDPHLFNVIFGDFAGEPARLQGLKPGSPKPSTLKFRRFSSSTGSSTSRGSRNRSSSSRGGGSGSVVVVGGGSGSRRRGPSSSSRESSRNSRSTGRSSME